MTNVLLYAPQNFRNLCLFTRTLEFFGPRNCYLFDPFRLLRERYGKSRLRELRATSAGAFQKVHWQPVEDPQLLIREHNGRTVATVAGSEGCALAQFRFSETDLLVFGSESRGLPAELVSACGAAVTIPTSGQTQSLNLAVALGVFLFEQQRQAVTSGDTQVASHDQSS